MLISCKYHILLICLFILSILKILYKKDTVIHLKSSFNFTLNTPYSEPRRYAVNITYDRLIDRNGFTFKINPNICTDIPLLLIITISSAPPKYKSRNIIRKTWGRINDAMKIVFTLGESNDTMETEDVIQESNFYKDIVQGNFLDTYRNLTYKHMMGLKWVTHHCPTARYVIKTDDDIFVNYDELIYFLKVNLSPWGAQNLIAGLRWLTTTMPVIRNNSTYKGVNKWALSREEYSPDEFPTYCSGAFILYSKEVLPLLVEASETTKYLCMEDVFATGILAQIIGVSRTDLSHLFNPESSEDLIENGIRNTKPFLFGPVNLQEEALYDIWRKYLIFDKYNFMYI